MSDGDSVNFVPIGEILRGLMGAWNSKVGVLKGLMDDWKDSFEMGASSNFRDDAAIACEKINLRNDDITKNSLAVLDNGSGGLIARSFDGKNIHFYII